MPIDSRSSLRCASKLPAGVLGNDYLTFLQLSVVEQLLVEKVSDDASLKEALDAICCGSMRLARPAMKVVFDGCRFWLASHFHRYEAARRLGARHQEFWCDIESGSKDDALRCAFAA